MRTLPEQMVSVSLVSLDEADVIVTTTEMFLLESMELAEYNSTGRIRVINHLGVTRSFPLYSDFINGTPRAESIAFKSNESSKTYTRNGKRSSCMFARCSFVSRLH